MKSKKNEFIAYGVCLSVVLIVLGLVIVFPNFFNDAKFNNLVNGFTVVISGFYLCLAGEKLLSNPDDFKNVEYQKQLSRRKMFFYPSLLFYIMFGVIAFRYNSMGIEMDLDLINLLVSFMFLCAEFGGINVLNDVLKKFNMYRGGNNAKN
jgi:membrane protease YdiL (CAAX protease family)